MKTGLFFSDEEFIFRIGYALMHAVWQSFLLGLILFVLFKLLAAASAKSRYLLGLFGMIVLFILPIVNYFNFQPDAVSGLYQTEVTGSSFSELIFPVQSQAFTASDDKSNIISWTESLITQIAPAMFWFWLAGLLAMLIYNLGGFYLNWRITTRYAFDAPDCWVQKLKILAAKMKISSSVQLMVSEKIVVPFTKGFLKPVILLPIALLSQLPADQLELVLAHELAHIKRRDYLINVFQILVESVLFFNPVVWWLSAVIRKEREHATDDLVVQHQNEQIKLAKALTNLLVFKSRRNLINHVVYFNKTSNMKRIERLLKHQSRKINFREKVMITLTLFALFLIISTGGSFADPAQSLMKLPDAVINLEDEFAIPDSLNERALHSKVNKTMEGEAGENIKTSKQIAKVEVREETNTTLAYNSDENSDSLPATAQFSYVFEFDFPDESLYSKAVFDTVVRFSKNAMADSLKMMSKMDEWMKQAEFKMLQIDSLQKLAEKFRFKARVLADSMRRTIQIKHPELFDSVQFKFDWERLQKSLHEQTEEIEDQVRVLRRDFKRPEKPENLREWQYEYKMPQRTEQDNYKRLLRKELLEDGTIDKGDRLVLSKKQLIINGKVADRKTQKHVLKRFEEITGSAIQSDTAIMIR